MSDSAYLLDRLGPRAQAGSKPRCHWLTHGDPAEVARRLTTIAAPFAEVSPSDRWMPRGFDEVDECQLHKRSAVLGSDLCSRLEAWWLAPSSTRAMTPNFDIASTCTIEGRRGLLLVEAKAHVLELENEAGGRKIDGATSERNASHEKIGLAIADAAAGLTSATGHPFRISRDLRYQMSNRFAWSWKLATEGVPVALVYLGFLGVTDRASWLPIQSREAWVQLVTGHSAALFPPEIWGRAWDIAGNAFVPIVSAATLPLRPTVSPHSVS